MRANIVKPMSLGWTRREFLRAASATGAYWSLSSVMGGDMTEPGATTPAVLLSRPGRWPMFRLIRPRDLLLLDLEMINLRVVLRDGKPWADIISHGKPGYLILHFPGQHIAEQAIWDRSNDPDTAPAPGDPAPPLTYEMTLEDDKNVDAAFLKLGRENNPRLAGAWLAGPTQLVFEVKQEMAPFAFDLDTILRLCAKDLPLVVSPVVDPEAAREANWSPVVPTVPEPWHGHHVDEDPPPFTAIEFPSLLYLSPYRNARWVLPSATGDRRCELWGLELEPPRSTPPVGLPREARPAGHLFAFSYRPAADSLWPKADPSAPPDADDGKKYGAAERAKTGLYEATRSLLVKQLGEDNGDITAQRLRLTSLGASARLFYRPAFEPLAEEQTNSEGGERLKGEKETKARQARLKGALRLVGITNKTKLEAAASAISSEANAKLPLTKAFEALRGSPAVRDFDLSEKAWAVVETIFVSSLGNTDDEGFLLEWIQKTEIGRDFYTKESFAGFWMPFGFKAEVVTITERLPSFYKKAFKPGTRDKTPLTNDEQDRLEEQEGGLTAFLVARKFARVRRGRDGTLRREFPSPESADFANWLGDRGRTAGLRSVEILVERTPVLANKYTDHSRDDDARAAEVLGAGADWIVDGGTGTLAAKETFWPRVEEFNLIDGKPTRTLAVYKFPIRLTYFDGREEVIQLPMFFVPSEEKGRTYYPMTPAILRLAPVSTPVAVVVPPIPAALTLEELGSAKVINKIKETLDKVVALPQARTILQTTNPGTAGQSIVSGAVNVFLGNMPDEIFRRLTAYQRDIGDYIESLGTGAQTKGASWAAKLDWMEKEVEKLGRNAKEVRALANRALAWGVDSLGAVDAVFAAERISYFLSSQNAAVDWTVSAQTTLKTLKNSLKNTPRRLPEFDAAAESLTREIDEFLELLTDSTQQDPKAYSEQIRLLVIHWSSRLAPFWRRDNWDKCFSDIAASLVPENFASHLINSIFHKEMQYAVLANKDKVFVADKWIFSFDDLALPPSFAKVVFKDKASSKAGQLISQTKDILSIRIAGAVVEIPQSKIATITAGPLVRALRSNLDTTTLRQTIKKGLLADFALTRNLLQAVEKSLPDERMLRQRIYWLLDEYPQFRKGFEEQLSSILDDIMVQIDFIATHARDGVERMREFVQLAVPGAESVESILNTFKDKLQESTKKIQTAIQTEVNTQTKKFTETLADLVMSANPERIKGQINEMLALTGGRLLPDLKDRILQARLAASDIVTGLGNPKNFEAVVHFIRQGDQVVDGILSKNRQDLENLLRDPRPSAVTRRAYLLLYDLGRSAQITGGITGPALRELQVFLGDLEETIRLFKSPSKQDLDALAGRLQKYLNSATNSQIRERAATLVKLLDASGTKIGKLEDLLLQAASLAGNTELLSKTLTEWFGSLAGVPKLDEYLQEAFGTAEELRREFGDFTNLSDLKNALAKLGSPDNVRAKKLKGLLDSWTAESTGTLAKLSEDVISGLEQRALNLGGESLNFVRRSLVSLPSADLVNSFADQTGKAVMAARDITFTVANRIKDEMGETVAFPQIKELSVRLPGVDGFRSIRAAESYLQQGLRDFDTQGQQVFAELTDAAAQAISGSAGVGAASAAVEKLSREAGAISREYADKAEGLAHKAKEYLKGKSENITETLNAEAGKLLGNPSPKIFGVIPLESILGQIQDASDIPRAIAREFPDRIEKTIRIRKDMQAKELSIVTFKPTMVSGAAQPALTLESSATAWLPVPGQTKRGISTSVRGQMGPFQLVIGKLVALEFQSLTFVSENGRFQCNPKLGIEGGNILDAIRFQDSLAFLQDIVTKFSSFLQGKLPFNLSIDSEAVRASMRIGLPNIGFGAVSIENLSLGMGIGLPLSSGRPLLFGFNLAERVNTFKVSVCGFAGGGFFAMQIASDPAYGSIEAAVEFGGNLSINLGVAKGSLTVMAGFYYRKQGRAEVTFEAYLRACGVVVVLGFIDISIVFFLALHYHRNDDCSYLEGEASITVRVKIGFFSKSFRLSYRKTITGSKSRRENENGTTASLGDYLDTLTPRELVAATDAIGAPPASEEKIEIPTAERRFTKRIKKEDWSRYWKQFNPSLINS